MSRELILSIAKHVDDPGYLFFNEDTSNGGVGKVVYRNLEWDRAKSNECVRERDFSFYYAAQAFIDKHRMFDRDRNSPSYEQRDILVGHPYGLDSEDLLVVVHIRVLESGRFRIISAFEAEGGSWYEDRYEMNKNMQLQASKRDHSR